MISIIGCGNPNRKDDGVGPEVIRLLRAAGVESDGVKLLDAGTDGMSVMFASRGCRSLIVIDAVQSGSEPGAVFEVPGAELERPHVRAITMHDFRWNHAIHAGRMIFKDEFPTDVIVLLIEAKELGLGIGLSPPVANAALKVASKVEDLLRARHMSNGMV